MRISDWSSDVCSSDLSTANTARPACPNLSLRAGREGDEAIEQLPARKHLSGERRYGEQRIAAAQQFGEEQKRRRPRCRHFLFSASRSRRSSGRAVTLQKADHTIVEGVVAITGDHVSGTNHVVAFQRRQR